MQNTQAPKGPEQILRFSSEKPLMYQTRQQKKEPEDEPEDL